MFKKTIALLLLSLVLNINAFYLDSKHKATIQVKSDNVYTSDTNVPIVYKFNLGTPFLGNGQDIVITTTSDVLIPRTVDSLGSGEYAIYYKDPAQSATSGGTELLVQWGGASVNVANDLTTWQNCHGSTDDYVLVIHGEEASANLTDESGNEVLTDSNLIYGETGVIGSCPGFSGAITQSNVGNVVSLNSVSTFTISAWISYANIAATTVGITKLVDANNSIQVGYITGGRMYFFAGATAKQTSFPLAGNMLSNTFCHMTFVYSGGETVNTNRARNYLNSVFMNDLDVGVIGPQTPNLAAADLYLSYPATPFQGKMDEVRLYTGALTAEQIQTQYDNQRLFNTNGSIIEGAIVLSRNKNMSKYNRPTYSKPIYKNDDYKNFIYNK